MTEANNQKTVPHIPEPTDAQITETIKTTKAKSSVTLSRADAARVVKLRQELGWWLRIDQQADRPTPISEDLTKEAQAHLEQSDERHVSLEEAALRAERSLLVRSMSEKDRIAQEIGDIINNAADISKES